MTYYKVNKKQTIGVILIIFTIVALMVVSAVFASKEMAYQSGVVFGFIQGFIFPLILSITKLNRSKPAIEKIEIEEKE